MASKITSIKRRGQGRKGGFVLTEIVVALGITILLFAAVCAFSAFSAKSFAAMFNYVDLDDINRIAMDQITRDLRQANRVTAFTSTSLTLEDSSLAALSYTYSAKARTLTRLKNGISRVILKDCDRLAFTVGQRNPVGGSYDVYPAATASTAKVVNVSWACSRTICGVKENTENVQTARIIIRKQGT